MQLGFPFDADLFRFLRVGSSTVRPASHPRSFVRVIVADLIWQPP